MLKRKFPAGFIVPAQPVERDKPASPSTAVVVGPDGLSRFDELRPAQASYSVARFDDTGKRFCWGTISSTWSVPHGPDSERGSMSRGWRER
jgi:hypothetical protein